MERILHSLKTTSMSALVLALALALSACATTQEARHVKETGFLDNYSRLKQVNPGEALEVYWNPDIDFSTYHKLIIDRIDIWCCSADSRLVDVPAPELEQLLLHFSETLRRKLGRDYELVNAPGPDVMRLHVALTEARKSLIPLDVFTTVYPSARVLSEIKRLATGTQAFVGSASFEVRVTDSETGAILFEEADRRAGGKSVEKWSTDAWHDVELIFESWADSLQASFREKRGVPPTADAATAPGA